MKILNQLCFIFFLSMNIFSCSSQLFKQLEWNYMNKELNPQITSYLLNSGYKKINVYYDSRNKVDGEWLCYGWSKIADDIYVINVSKIPDSKTGYNYIIIYSDTEKEIIFESEPFYDSALEIEFQRLKNRRILLNIGLIMEDEIDYKKLEIEY